MGDFFTTAPLSLPGTEETNKMIDDVTKQLKNPDSLVSLFLGVAVVVVTGILIFNYVKDRKPDTAKTETKQEQKSETNMSLPATYTVASGDSLWSIAQKYFGSGYNWTDIATANTLADANLIEAGQKLTVPNVPKRPEGQTLSNSVEVKMPADGKYTVKPGDTLWTISADVYGTGFRWVEIAQKNTLANPNTIHTGNVLMLP